MKHRMNYLVIFILCFVWATISRVDSYQRFILMVSRVNLHTVCLKLACKLALIPS